jgi:hypothetical protein
MRLTAGLGHGQAFGSAMEVQLFRDRNEGGKVFKVVAHIDARFASIRLKTLFYTL